MANDKDFIVKNAVEVGGNVKTTVGTVTSGAEGYYLTGASYTQGYTQSQSTDPRGPVFKTDGTKMYLVTITTVYQYSLSTAWDVTTASYESKSFNASSQDSQPYGARFKPDGTKMFIVGATNDSIFQYSLSTAWDVSTASYDSVTLSVNSQDATPTALAFKPDGTKMFIAGAVNDSIFQYSLSTAWDLSTASYDSVSLSVSSQDSFPDGVDFNSTGTNMFVSGSSSDSVYQYTLSTAWDLSTASYSNISFSVASQATTPYGLVFGDSGTKMYITNGNSPYNILQYSTALTTQTLDLSTGNYFNDTLAYNTKYIFSNAGAVQSFQVEVTGGTAAYDLSSISYDNISYSVTAQELSPNGIAFKPDGTKMYVSGNSGDTIDQYSLSTAWDVTTASFDSVSLGVNSQDNNPWGLFFKSDGTKMYVQGYGNDGVYQYSLSTAWDLSTASYDSVSLSISAQSTTPKGLAFKSDGTALFIGDSVGNNVYQYTLTTAWDLSTASYASISYAVSGLSTLQAITFNSDGTYLYILDSGSDEIVKQYSLSTAWNVSTASATGNTLTVTSQDTIMHGLVFKPDGTRLYITGNTGDYIYQYSSADTTLTWPTSLEWPLGITPFAPANGQTDLYTISTDDGGTTYIGLHTADNLS